MVAFHPIIFSCGFGGSTSIEHPEVAKRLLNNKLNNAESTGAAILVADNPGCLMHLRGRAARVGEAVPLVHLATALAQGVRAGSGPGESS